MPNDETLLTGKPIEKRVSPSPPSPPTSPTPVKQNPTCSVCLGEVEKFKPDTVILPCGHRAHKSCIEPWCRTHNTCPVCRANLPEPLRKKLSPLLSPVPQTQWDRALLEGEMQLDLSSMDPDTTEFAIASLNEVSADLVTCL